MNSIDMTGILADSFSYVNEQGEKRKTTEVISEPYAFINDKDCCFSAVGYSSQISEEYSIKCSALHSVMARDTTRFST